MSFCTRFRTMIIVGVLTGLVIGGYVSYSFVLHDASAQGQREIPIQAQRFLSESTVLVVGDSCSFTPDILRFFMSDSQIVVTDEDGTIIAMEEIIGEVETGSTGSLLCRADFDIPVPEAEFYTVHLGDQRVVGFSEGDFPIELFDEVWINFD